MRSWLLACLLCSACASRQRVTDVRDQISTGQLLEVANVLEQCGDTVRAEQYLHAAIKQGADEEVLVPRLLRMYASDGQYRLAIEYGEHYLRRHPHHLPMRLLVASLYTAVGAQILAQEQYERVLIANPRHADAHFALASLLHEQGRDRALADSHFRAYLELEPKGRYAEEARSQLLTEVP